MKFRGILFWEGVNFIIGLYILGTFPWETQLHHEILSHFIIHLQKWEMNFFSHK
jgi:hypothetical protein